MFFSTDNRAHSFIKTFFKSTSIFSFHFDIWCFSPLCNDNFQEELQANWFLCLILCSLYQFYHTFSFQWFWWWHLIYSCEQAIHCIADRRFRESPRQPRIKMNPLHIWSWFWIFCFFVLTYHLVTRAIWPYYVKWIFQLSVAYLGPLPTLAFHKEG